MANVEILHQVIGAPSYFPTVWGWIKRWFDPVTVKKIFILGHHEVKAKLSEFIDPDDIPKKYGGNLDWDVGMSPHLDQAATEAVERNGSKGWIEGPCLWEQGQRVPVGTVSGKARRPVNLVAVPVSAPAAAEVEAEGEAEAEGNANTAPPPTLPPANDPTETEAAKQAPIRLPNPNLPASTNPSSFTAHSATTTSTSVTPPDITISAPSPPPPTTMLTTTAAATAAAASFPEPTPDCEGPIVVAGEVLPASAAVKPPMERFVTAVEDLHLHSASPQVNGVVA
jgi:CRAL/TRIO domain